MLFILKMCCLYVVLTNVENEKYCKKKKKCSNSCNRGLSYPTYKQHKSSIIEKEDK